MDIQYNQNYDQGLKDDNYYQGNGSFGMDDNLYVNARIQFIRKVYSILSSNLFFLF